MILEGKQDHFLEKNDTWKVSKFQRLFAGLDSFHSSVLQLTLLQYRFHFSSVSLWLLRGYWLKLLVVKNELQVCKKCIRTFSVVCFCVFLY